MIPKIFTEIPHDKECYIILEQKQDSVIVRIVNKHGDYLCDPLIQFVPYKDGISTRLLMRTKVSVSQGDKIYITLK